MAKLIENNWNKNDITVKYIYPWVDTSKIKPIDNPAKAPFKEPSSSAQGNNHKTDQLGPIPIKERNSGDI